LCGGLDHANDEALWNTICKTLQRRERSFDWAGAHALVSRWKKAVDKDGEHIEK
jgi:hypothetical protein